MIKFNNILLGNEVTEWIYMYYIYIYILVESFNNFDKNHVMKLQIKKKINMKFNKLTRKRENQSV